MATQTLVLVPGLGSDAAVWRGTIAALGDGYRCLVGDTLSDDTLQGMARRIVDQAPHRFALAGVSMGGMVALEIMRAAPERVTHLALVDTNARADTFRQKIYRRLANVVVGTSNDYGRLAQRNLGSLIHPSTGRDIRTEIVQMSVRVGAKNYLRQNRAVIARGDLRKILPSIAVPTAIIVGRDDQMTPVALSCISRLPAVVKPARLRTQASPSISGVIEPVFERGAACVRLSERPNSRQGRSSPHLQGWVMDEPRSASICVGIDVSKDRLDVHLRPSDEAFAVTRDSDGLENLVERLRALDVSLIVLEATGGFETTVAAALAGVGLPLAVVNPRQVRDFARALGRLAKTDAIDAKVIALFAERIGPPARPIASPEAQRLGELVARRRQIVEMIGMEQNRRRRAGDKRLVKKIDRHVAFLEKELADVDADIDAGVRASPAWREAEELRACRKFRV
jgi:pimeloyl-ACP methyl ester carboxylesterase